jgi:hypothetical protein
VDSVDRVLEGAIDLHCHSGPSPFPRRIDHAEAARQAAEAGMRAIVVKSHHHSTVMDVLAMKPWAQIDNVELFGGIALNGTVGGLNAEAVELALRMGGKVVWFPTISSPQHIEHHRAQPGMKFPASSVALRPERPLDILDESGGLRPEVFEILEIVKETGAILAGGHMAPDRIIALFEAAHDVGITRLLVNHPNFVIEADEEQVVKLADLGAFIEHSLCMYDEDSTFHQWDLGVLMGWIELVGPERTTLGSDLGQVNNPLPVESFRKICGRLLEAGVGEDAVRHMIVENPATLLGLP